MKISVPIVATELGDRKEEEREHKLTLISANLKQSRKHVPVARHPVVRINRSPSRHGYAPTTKIDDQSNSKPPNSARQFTNPTRNHFKSCCNEPSQLLKSDQRQGTKGGIRIGRTSKARNQFHKFRVHKFRDPFTTCGHSVPAPSAKFNAQSNRQQVHPMPGPRTNPPAAG